MRRPAVKDSVLFDVDLDYFAPNVSVRFAKTVSLGPSPVM
jgi:hypothetical protein